MRARAHVLCAILLSGVAGAAFTSAAYAQVAPARVLIAAAIDETQRISLPGNVRPEATSGNDRGRVADGLPMQHMQLLLRRPVEREQALQQYLRELHDRSSPDFHRWLSPAQLGQRFGLASQDLSALTAWLRRHGFTVNTVYASTLVIDFSGTAGQVNEAFHCEIHALEAGGARHTANMTDPQIPAALAPAVVGIVSLHDFAPRKMLRQRTDLTTTTGNTPLAPADLATIYNFGPLFARGITGVNQTIVVIEDSNVTNPGDWTTFRSTFGLSGYGTAFTQFTQVHPNCTDPGVTSSADEATLDAEWASAAAPSAAIELAACADTSTFGGLIALENLLNQGNMPAIVSISYGECEAENGAVGNAAYSTAYQQAVAQGVSVYVSAGDEGAASCDAFVSTARHGIGVNGFASTPYNVAVGGTDFGDTYAGTVASYWSSSNSPTWGSALSYVPEIPWSDSCASVLISNYYGGGAVPYGTGGFCNSTTGNQFLTTVAGSGGPSGCAQGRPSLTGIVGGTCTGTPKPSWQSGVPGIPNDGVRDLPDISLFAGNGIWNHYYVFCWTSGTYSCAGAPSTWAGAGGTSFGTPILAGVQALVNQSTGARQGNPNYVFYALAASQSASGIGCNSSNGNTVNTGCVFYDVTAGDNDVNCITSHNCYRPSGTNGVLSTSSNAYAKAYGTATGWDFATGLGTVNAFNLVSFWSSSDLALRGSGQVTSGGLLAYTLTLTNSGPQTGTGVTVSVVLPSGVTLVASASSPGCTQVAQTVSCTMSNLAAGSSEPLTITLQPPPTGQAITLNFNATDANGDLDTNNDVATVSLIAPGNGESGASGDAPLPQWAMVALASLLIVIATVRERRQAGLG